MEQGTQRAYPSADISAEQDRERDGDECEKKGGKKGSGGDERYKPEQRIEMEETFDRTDRFLLRGMGSQ